MSRARTTISAVVIALALTPIVGGVLVSRAQAPAPPLPIPPGALPPPDGGAGAPRPPSNTVKIVFITVPMKPAMVFWGKKRLGVIAPHQPLVVQRPRDSGPLDVVVRADGYVPVQTRAYTFADGKVAVKITPVDQKSTLLGFRQELPPADGGASGMPGDCGPSGCGQVIPPVGPLPDGGPR
jgi:hypothetical protein